MVKEVVYSAIAVYIAFIALLIWLSNKLGADFEATVRAVTFSAMIVVVTLLPPWIGAGWTRPNVESVIFWQTMGLPLHWLSWFQVLDSIVRGGRSGNDRMREFIQPEWFNAPVTHWGVFVALTVLCIVLYVRRVTSR